MRSSKIVMTSVVQVVMLLSGSVRWIRCFWPTQIILAGGTVFFRNGHDAVFFSQNVFPAPFSRTFRRQGILSETFIFSFRCHRDSPETVLHFVVGCDIYIFFYISFVFFNFTTKTDVDRGTITTLHPEKGLKRKISSVKNDAAYRDISFVSNYGCPPTPPPPPRTADSRFNFEVYAEIYIYLPFSTRPTTFCRFRIV